MSRLFALSTVVGVLVLASLASTASGAPLVDRFHGTVNDDGTFKDQFRLNQVFTSAATCKSVLIVAANQFVGAGPIDNGDGTVTFTSTFKGLPENVKLPNGRGPHP